MGSEQPVYQDLLVVFHGAPPDVRATVWRRRFPQGRQQRRQVAEFPLRGLGADPTPQDLVKSLWAALEHRAGVPE